MAEGQSSNRRCFLSRIINPSMTVPHKFYSCSKTASCCFFFHASRNNVFKQRRNSGINHRDTSVCRWRPPRLRGALKPIDYLFIERFRGGDRAFNASREWQSSTCAVQPHLGNKIGQQRRNSRKWIRSTKSGANWPGNFILGLQCVILFRMANKF